MPIVIIILLLLFLVLICYLIYQIVKVKRRVKKEVNPLSGLYDQANDEYYENVYDTANNLYSELGAEPRSKLSYLELKDAGQVFPGSAAMNEYLEVKEGSYYRNSTPGSGGERNQYEIMDLPGEYERLARPNLPK